MKISDEAKKELLKLSLSSSLRKDMQEIASNRLNPFLKDADAYIEFINQFNEFVNHAPKPFRPIIERVMKL